MKSRVKSQYQQHDIILSIGMIVKNEEKNLRECLDALVPLMEQVPSELIIADTGSTDKTVEIAEEYADHLLHFEWCNDFAAARNVTVQKATGEWYMFIDADEILDEDVSSMVEFFNGEEQKKYNCATLIQRNYTTKEHTMFSDFMGAGRLFRRYPGMKFEGIIHEAIPAVLPKKNLLVPMHHDGYIDSVSRDKQFRNRKLLLEELESDRNFVRTARHLVDTYDPFRPEEREEAYHYLFEILDRTKEDLKNGMRCYAYIQLVLYSLTFRKYEELDQYVAQYFAEKDGKSHCATDMELLFYHAESYKERKEYDKAVECYQEYHKIYKKFEKEELEDYDQGQISFVSTPKTAYLNSLYLCSMLYLQDKRAEFEKSKEWLRYADAETQRLAPKEYANIDKETLYIRESKDYARAAERYTELAEIHDGMGNKLYSRLYDKAFEKEEEERRGVWKQIATLDMPEDPYVLLCKLRTEDFTDREEEADKLIQDLLALPDVLGDTFFSDIVYYTMRYDLEIAPLIFALQQDKVEPFLTSAAIHHGEEIGKLIYEYLYWKPMDDPNSMRELYWRTRLFMLAIATPDALDKEHFGVVLEKYTEEMARYCQMVYVPDALLPENRMLLPQEYSFAMAMDKAFEQQRENGQAAYLRQLKLLLKEYPSMHVLIDRISDFIEEDLQEEEKARKKERKEFEDLAVAVKAQFFAFLQAGKLDEASQVLESYRQVNGKDPDIHSMKNSLKKQIRKSK